MPSFIATASWFFARFSPPPRLERELLLAGVELGVQQVDVRLRLGLRQRRDGDGVLQHLLHVVARDVLVSALRAG